MKAVFITYNQSISDEVQEILDELNIRGYTQWTDVKGQGSKKGEPHQGTHTWPALNNAHLTVIEDNKVTALLEKLKTLDSAVEEEGLRAFVWDIVSEI